MLWNIPFRHQGAFINIDTLFDEIHNLPSVPKVAKVLIQQLEPVL